MPETVRIQKYLSEAGVCSRREAERLVFEGKVTINGHAAKPGNPVRPGEDVVKVGRKIVAAPARKIVLMMNKPKGYLCTNRDDFGGQTVFELVPPPWNKLRLFCVGRLDKDSEGLLLLTNDGELANRVMHPSGGVMKRYEVQVNRPFDVTLIPRLLKGVKDEDEFLRFRKVMLAEGAPDRLEIHLDQGRKREIRRLLEIFGFHVKRLRRFQVGELVLRRMPEGDCRLLSQKEIAMIVEKSA
jgi:23S rRNA pseudouridine2605 synthase